MGLVATQITLANARRDDVAPVVVDALADTGAVHLCIPEHVALQLGLEELERREATLADGSRRTVSYVRPVRLHLQNRTDFTGAMVLGDEVLLGAIPMEDMDLVVVPTTRQVIPNPANPNIAASSARGFAGSAPRRPTC